MKVHQLEKKSTKLVSLLKVSLSDTFILYLKTLNYHWHVTGPAFYTLHEAFELQYKDLAEAIDELAERLRQLNEIAPATTQALLNHATLKEGNTIPTAGDMLKQLIADHTQVAQECKQVIEVANNLNHETTADLLIKRVAFHEKTIWMLKSSLP